VAGSCLQLEAICSANVVSPEAPGEDKTQCFSNRSLLSDKGRVRVRPLEIAAQTLDILVNPGTNWLSLSLLELYSLKRKRKLFALKFADKFVQLIRQSIQICAVASNPHTKNRLRALILLLPVLEFLRGLATAQLGILVSGIVEPLSKTAETSLLQWLRVLIDHLLDDQENGGLYQLFLPFESLVAVAYIGLDNTDLDPEV